MQKITLAIGALALAMLIDAQPSQAYYEGAWCGYTKAGRGTYGSRCDLMTYEACRAWINAQAGSYCTENPRYRVVEKPVKRKAKLAR